jgi:serpin B
MVKDLLDAKASSASGALILTSAISFEARWVQPFDKALTRASTFTTPGGPKQVSMMVQTVSAKLFNGDTVQVLELPYEGGPVVMDVVLPREANGLSRLEENLKDHLHKWLPREKDRLRQVAVTLPRFSLAKKVNLKPYLQLMGLKTPFVPGKALFPGLLGKSELAVGPILHAVEMRVNEQGTVATAATASSVIAKSRPANRFDANRPFLFLLREPRTNTLLFLGRVLSPTGNGPAVKPKPAKEARTRPVRASRGPALPPR